jgi:hypothetical protein
MCVFKNHAFIYFLRPPSWSGTLTWRTSFFTRGVNTLPLLSLPPQRSSYNIYIDDINNISRPRLVQDQPAFKRTQSCKGSWVKTHHAAKKVWKSGLPRVKVFYFSLPWTAGSGFFAKSVKCSGSESRSWEELIHENNWMVAYCNFVRQSLEEFLDRKAKCRPHKMLPKKNTFHENLTNFTRQRGDPYLSKRNLLHSFGNNRWKRQSTFLQ